MRTSSPLRTRPASRSSPAPRRGRLGATVAAAAVISGAVAGVSPGTALAADSARAADKAFASTAAPTNRVELSTNSFVGKLVLTARGTSPSSPVGLAFDNDSSLGQWKFVSLDGLIKKGMYVLRHTEGTSKPLCLTAFTGAFIGACDSSDPGQRWTLTSGQSLKNDYNRTIQRPANPILVSTLSMGFESNSQPFTRTFIGG